MKMKLVESRKTRYEQRKTYLGPNDDQSHLGPFHSLHVASVDGSLEPNTQVSCEIRIEILTNNNKIIIWVLIDQLCKTC
jgi:hypothetical protein